MPEVYKYAIRFDGTDEAPFLAWLGTMGGAYFVVRESHDNNPHFHAVLHSERKINAVRMALRRKFPETHGNGSYSLTLVRDLEKYMRYMCKGASVNEAPDVVGRNGIGYTDTAVAGWHEQYWATNAELQEARAEMTVMEACIAACKDASVDWRNREKIAELYIRELVRRRKPINLFSVRSSVNFIQVEICEDDSAILDLAAHCAQY